MAAQNMPAAEVDVTKDLVRRLLGEQHPDLADRPLRLVANGWDNVIFRLGDDLSVRMPRRQLAADLVVHEQRWLPVLAERLPLVIPTPVRLGDATGGYPWRWSICPWLEGDVAADVALAAPGQEAERLGHFLATLHVAAPSDAPCNPYRGGPVIELSERFAPRVDQLDGLLDVATLLDHLDGLLDVQEWSGPAVWIHGDLHTANLLVADGTISSVIDWGDVTSGDPACDFAIAWMLFDRPDRDRFRRAAGGVQPIDDATWQRAEAWALHFAVMYLLHSADSGRFERMGTSLLAALLD